MMPGLFKITSTQVPAKKARMGIDPFTKVERKFAAKPATTKVKVRAMKKLEPPRILRRLLRLRMEPT